jgi:hypothetical protein
MNTIQPNHPEKKKIDILIEQVDRFTQRTAETELWGDRVNASLDRANATLDRVDESMERISVIIEQQAIVATRQAQSIAQLIALLGQNLP